MHVDDRIESGHMPIFISVLFPNRNAFGDVDDSPCYIDKYIWIKEKAQEYKENFSNQQTVMKIDAAITMIDVDVNMALNMFNECITECAACMKKRIFV